MIAGADVVATSVDKGVSFPAKTNAEGDYQIAGLVAGKYNLAISQTGFKKFAAHDIVLEVAQKARVDATLEIGEVTNEVTVEGTDVAQVETQSVRNFRRGDTGKKSARLF